MQEGKKINIFILEDQKQDKTFSYARKTEQKTQTNKQEKAKTNKQKPNKPQNQQPKQQQNI